MIFPFFPSRIQRPRPRRMLVRIYNTLFDVGAENTYKYIVYDLQIKLHMIIGCQSMPKMKAILLRSILNQL